MDIIKQIEVMEYNKLKVNDFELVGEVHNFLCRTCMRIIKDTIFMLVLDDETKAIVYYYNPPNQKDQYVCEECKQEKEKVVKRTGQYTADEERKADEKVEDED